MRYRAKSKADSLAKLGALRDEIVAAAEEGGEASAAEEEDGTGARGGGATGAEAVAAKAARLEAKFRSLAEAESDCGSHAQGGDLGAFGRGKMQACCSARPGSMIT